MYGTGVVGSCATRIDAVLLSHPMAAEIAPAYRAEAIVTSRTASTYRSRSFHATHGLS